MQHPAVSLETRCRIRYKKSTGQERADYEKQRIGEKLARPDTVAHDAPMVTKWMVSEAAVVS